METSTSDADFHGAERPYSRVRRPESAALPKGAHSNGTRSNAVRRRREHRRSLARLALVLSLAAATSCGSTTPVRALPEAIEPPSSVRTPAEWEPIDGVFVSYPFEVPDQLVQALARRTTLFVLVDSARLADLEGDMWRLGLDPRDRDEDGEPTARWEAVSCTAEEAYPRDFGPHQIVVDDGRLAVLDQVFQGYPIYPHGTDRDAHERWSYLFETGPGEDEVAQAVAAHLDLARYVAPFALTGGNFLVDGAGTAFFTDALVDENLDWHERDDIMRLVHRYTGCSNLVHLANVEEVGIQHIDCVLKPLPGNRILVQDVPNGHPARARVEALVRELEDVRDADGAPFEILRIPCPVVERERWGDESPVAAYTNSLIAGGTVYVPLYGVAGDETALAVWRAALPDHEVLGFLDHAGGAPRVEREPDPEPSGEGNRRRRRRPPTPPVYEAPPKNWQSYDALHCRTRALFARPGGTDADTSEG